MINHLDHKEAARLVAVSPFKKPVKLAVSPGSAAPYDLFAAIARAGRPKHQR
jgi:hypothetical protein